MLDYVVKRRKKKLTIMITKDFCNVLAPFFPLFFLHSKEMWGGAMVKWSLPHGLARCIVYNS